MRLNFQNVRNNQSNWGLSSCIRMHGTCWILEKSQAFRSIKTPYHDNMAYFLVPWSLTIEINIQYMYDALVTGCLVCENVSGKCASTTLFSKRDTVVLALWVVYIKYRNGEKALLWWKKTTSRLESVLINWSVQTAFHWFIFQIWIRI